MIVVRVEIDFKVAVATTPQLRIGQSPDYGRIDKRQASPRTASTRHKANSDRTTVE